MLPFRAFKPPILNTPFSTIPLPPTKVTIPLILASFGIILSGIVFCYVKKAKHWAQAWGPNGKIVKTWLEKNTLSNQCWIEGFVVAVISVMGGISALAAYYVMSTPKKERKGVLFGYIEAFSYTIPVWALLLYEVCAAKIPSYTVDFNA